jgi:hypothetical protein
VKEVIQGIYVDEIDEKVLFDRLNEIIKRNGKVIVSEEESKKIGFSPKYLSNDKCCEPCDVPEEDEGEGWAELPSNTVKVKGFVTQEIVDAFYAPVAQEARPIVEELDPPVNEPTMDELMQKRNEIMKEWSEKDKKDD